VLIFKKKDTRKSLIFGAILLCVMGALTLLCWIILSLFQLDKSISQIVQIFTLKQLTKILFFKIQLRKKCNERRVRLARFNSLLCTVKTCVQQGLQGRRQHICIYYTLWHYDINNIIKYIQRSNHKWLIISCVI